jgi:hypothetical protein
MRGRGVPLFVKKIVFGVLAKILFIQLDIQDTCHCKKKVNSNWLYFRAEAMCLYREKDAVVSYFILFYVHAL